MPTYFEMLRMADAPLIPEQSILDLLKTGGFPMLGALLAIGVGAVLLLLALLGRDRKWILRAFVLAVLATGFGWLGSYAGYRQAGRIVSTAEAQPTEAELVAGANLMQTEGVLPTGLALALGIIGLGMLPFMKERPEDPSLR